MQSTHHLMPLLSVEEITAHNATAPADTGHIYLCIDLKSFYASVECADRGLDPFTTNLVVADPSRTDKTICLAITPAMKELGIPNRCRVFEIPKHINFIMAKPRMQHYMDVSAKIYGVYLRYVAAEDMHVYSIDEVFIDATPYLKLYNKTPRELAVMLMDAVFKETGICATAGIGTNLFLAKIALDITAKHVEDHIGYLDDAAFKEQIWHHHPITDIWNIGPGIARRLAKYGVHDLAGVCTMKEETLYREFGVNAEFLIDHARGIEPCTIADIQAYVPEGSSLSNGQVLPCDYSFDEARNVMREMADALILELVEKGLVAESVFLRIGYARDASQTGNDSVYQGEHGKRGPTAWHGEGYTGGSRKLSGCTAMRSKILPAFDHLFDTTTDRFRPIRRMNIGFGRVMPEEMATLDLFTSPEAAENEQKLQHAILELRGKFGKNAVLHANSLKEKATARERNNQIGGHHA